MTHSCLNLYFNPNAPGQWKLSNSSIVWLIREWFLILSMRTAFRTSRSLSVCFTLGMFNRYSNVMSDMITGTSLSFRKLNNPPVWSLWKWDIKTKLTISTILGSTPNPVSNKIFPFSHFRSSAVDDISSATFLIESGFPKWT